MLAPMTIQAQVVVEKSTEIITISNKQYYMHHVKRGETLYSIARVYEVSEAEIRKLNPEIDELGLQAEMVIGIPVITNQGEGGGEGYTVYTVEESEKTKKLLRRLKVDEDDFRRLNPTVGSYVFVGQKLMIPAEVAAVVTPEVNPVEPQDYDTIVPPVIEISADTIIEEGTLTGPYFLPEERPDTCYPSPENASRHYHVALLVPLYLDDVEKIDVSHEKAEKTKNTRAMKFLQFYEGFMMAVDSLTKQGGMHLDLTVIDVHENVNSAQAAVRQLQNESVDLIVGPFFSKSFAVVEDYALSRNITIVNPMSERESVILGAPNVIKLKPSIKSMVGELADLIKTKYPKAKVTLISDGNLDNFDMVEALEQMLDSVVAKEVFMSNEEMLELIDKESARRNMGKRKLSTLEVEGQIFSTKALQENPEGTVWFENHFQSLSNSEIDAFRNSLSSGRENVLVAYGKDIVFATKILNTINKSTQKFPITLIGLPTWENFDNLLVTNLLNMNAIYFDEHFVDFNDSLTLKFVDDFRLKYESEPS